MKEVFHPRSMLIYLFIIFILALLYNQTSFLLAMFMGLVAFNLKLDRARAWLKMIRFALPLMALIILINVIINHHGPVWWEWHQLGLSLSVHREAAVFGLSMSLRLLVVLSVFTAFNLVLSIEKLLEIFPARRGTAIMVAVITAKMVPDLAQRVRGIQEVQRVRCRSINGDTLLNRCRGAGIILINVLRAALEGAWKSGEAMQARGFGASDTRSSYLQHRWRGRDSWLVISASSAFFLALLFNILLNGTGFLNIWINGNTTLWGGIVPLCLLGTGILFEF